MLVKDHVVYAALAPLFAYTAYLLTKLIRLVHLYTRRSSLPRYSKSPTDGRSWAMVTGASDGIGLAFAQELAHRGFNVVLHGRNVAKLHQAELSVKEANPGVEVRMVTVDALQSADALKVQLASMVETLRDIHLTVLVNNIGGHTRQPPQQQFETDTLDDIERYIQLNAKFPLQLTSVILPLLLRHKNPSLILNIGSLIGEIGSPWLSMYAGSKAFLLSWSRSLQMEQQGEGRPIEVLGILAGVVTGVSYRKRTPSLFMPHSKTLASAALDRVGCGKLVVIPHFPHALMVALVGILPEGLLRTLLISGVSLL